MGYFICGNLTGGERLGIVAVQFRLSYQHLGIGGAVGVTVLIYACPRGGIFIDQVVSHKYLGVMDKLKSKDVITALQPFTPSDPAGHVTSNMAAVCSGV